MGLTKIEIAKQKEDRVGEQNINRYGELMTIVEYRTYKDIDVKFEDDNTIVTKIHYLIAKLAKKRDVKIINVTPESLLDAYPRKDISHLKW